MSDWIDKLKQDQDREAAQQADRDREKLRKHEIVKSRLPDFMMQVREQAKVDAEKLRNTFPNDSRYDLHFQAESTGFRLSHSSALRTMQLRLAIDERNAMARALVTVKDKNSGEQFNSIDLAVGLDVNDKVVIQFEERNFYRADELAEALVRYVLRDALR